MMIWIPESDDREPTDDELDSIEQDMNESLDELDLTDEDQLLLASMMVHLRLHVIGELMLSLSELMDPDLNDHIGAEDIRLIRELIDAVDTGVARVKTRWDM